MGNATIHDGDLVVGVNRAATSVTCNVWVAADSPLIEREAENVKGSPLLVTSPNSIDVLRDHKFTWRGKVFDETKMFGFAPHPLNYVTFSSTIALVYCGFVGATEVDVYGADWSGTADFDGKVAGLNRSADRWKLEREIWGNVIVPYLSERGITVTRHV